MRGIDRGVQAQQIGHFLRAHTEYGTHVAELLEVSLAELKATLPRS